MRKMNLLIGVAAVATLTVATPGTVAGAPKDGCPGGESGWGKGSVSDVATEIYGGLVEGPYGTLEEFTALIDAVYDRNEDDRVCLATRWGTRPAERAHWYGISLFIVKDNNANG